MQKHLPQDLTSYDFFKAYALILMLVDHTGYYFFPDDLWWRAVGRLCVPVWFFLIGYANSRDIGPRLWIGMLILVVANMVTGMSIIPLNILGTMIFLRLVLDPVMKASLKDYEILAAICMVVFILVLPLGILWEYGTLGLFYAMYGWFRRHPEQVKYPVKGIPEVFAVFAVAAFVGIESLGFGFDKHQIAFVAVGITMVTVVLYFFKPATFPALTKALPFPAAWTIRLLGRRTLEIYVIHLTMFKFAALMLAHDPRFGWFDFTVLSDD